MRSLLACACFQEFLRCIPGSLLCCELHQEWMEVLEDEDDDEEEQVQDIKRCKKNNNPTRWQGFSEACLASS